MVIPVPRKRQGQVVSIQAGPPRTLTITLGGDPTEIPGIRYLDGFAPVAGETVEILQNDSDLLVLGRVAVAAGAVYAERLTNLALTTSYQDVATLPAITGDAVTPWRVEISWWGVNPDGEVGPLITFGIREGSTVIDEARGFLASNSTENGGSRSIILVPSAAAHTYKFSALSSVGTPILEATATHRAQISARPWT
jgi:hypothetical protein